MATATIYLYEDPTQNYSISCWADRSFSRGTAVVRKTVDSSSTAVAATLVTAGAITPGSLTSMPSSNLQKLVFSYAQVSNYKINISAATLYVTLASNTNFDGIDVSGQFYSYPVYNTEYSGAVDLSSINTTEKTITATLRIDPQMSTSVLQALGGGSWSVHKEATIRSDTYYYSDEIDDVYYYFYRRYYFDDTGIQRSWCSAKITNVYLVITYEEDTTTIVDRSSAVSMVSVGVSGVAKKVTDMFMGVNGVAKKISDAWIGVNGIARKFWPCLELKDVPAGSIIQLDETGDGTLVDYIVVAQNHYLNETNTEGHTVFMRKNVLSTKVAYGNNTSGDSYVGEELDKYVNVTWKASLDERIILKLMDITIPCTKWSNPYKTTAERQIWVPARAELDNSEDFATKHEAPCFAYFENITTNADRIAYNDSGTATAWWTRSCVEGTSPYVRVVTAAGGYTNYNQTTRTGVRPVFCLPNFLPVSLISEGQYDLIL